MTLTPLYRCLIMVNLILSVASLALGLAATTRMDTVSPGQSVTTACEVPGQSTRGDARPEEPGLPVAQVACDERHPSGCCVLPI
jgi:hypothetical protein